ncbi:hypothetical protein HDU96_003360, partial [Phlyctochytrium bullatum]
EYLARQGIECPKSEDESESVDENSSEEQLSESDEENEQNGNLNEPVTETDVDEIREEEPLINRRG